MLEWSKLNKGTYYSRLRKLREKVCREIVPIGVVSKVAKSSEIKITQGNIVLTLLIDATIYNILKKKEHYNKTELYAHPYDTPQEQRGVSGEEAIFIL